MQLKTHRIFFRILACLIPAIMVCLFLPNDSPAVPASPETYEIIQPDGTVIQVRKWGDERSHGLETIDGYAVIKDESTGYLNYAVSDNAGGLRNSGNPVGIDTPPFDALQNVRQQVNSTASPMFRTTAESRERVVPAIGIANVPVLLIEFSDAAFFFTAGQFNTLLFGATGTSMNAYYLETSYGNFGVSAGPSGIPAWITAANTHNYYGTNVTCGPQQYDQHTAELVIEAVNAVDAGFNFDPYDQDNDCYVDIVGIVHQGTGEETGIATDIWSHRWTLNSAQAGCGDGTGQVTTDDICSANPSEKIKVNDYIIMPERYNNSPTISTIGVFAHEYGHALGLPDLYDTDGSSEGIGEWSLMASGSWNSVTLGGDSPAHMDPWSKYYLGWVTPFQVITTLTNELIDEASGNADVYKLLSGTPIAGEYFLVENRQQTGFDVGLPGDGLLIWHIDTGQQNNKNECVDHSNCPVNHYRVALEQADNLWDLENNQNRGDAGDPFPGTQANIAFSEATAPDSYRYNGTASNVSVTSISASQTNMTATLSIGPPPAAPGNLSATTASSSTINLSWADNSNNETGFNIERSTTGAAGPYSEIATVLMNITTYSDTGLAALTEYFYRVIASNTAGDSAPSTPAGDTTFASPPAPAAAASSGGGGGGGCFIATAAYGSYMADEVMVLREFRDKYLLTNPFGRELVKVYYKNSPPIADVIKKNEFLKTFTRISLTPVVMGIAYPYQSLAIFIVLLFSAIALRLIRRQKAMNYPAAELRGIKSVIPARPESFCIKEGFPTSLPAGRQAGMTKVTKTIETPMQSIEEFF